MGVIPRSEWLDEARDLDWEFGYVREDEVVARRAHVRVLHEGNTVDAGATMALLGVRPLDRFDVLEAEP